MKKKIPPRSQALDLARMPAQAAVAQSIPNFVQPCTRRRRKGLLPFGHFFRPVPIQGAGKAFRGSSGESGPAFPRMNPRLENCSHRLLKSCLLMLLMTGSVHAQETVWVSPQRFEELKRLGNTAQTPTTTDGKNAAPAPSTPNPGTNDAPQDQKTSNINDWGLGIGIGVEHFKDEYINEARIFGSDRVVRVSDSWKNQTNLWALGTWTPARCSRLKIINHFCSNYVSPGLYFGVNMNADGKLIDAFSLGIQMTFMERVLASTSGNEGATDASRPSWVVGFGVVNHSTKRLLEGISPNAPLPSQFEQVEYRKGRENSLMLVVTKIIGRK